MASKLSKWLRKHKLLAALGTLGVGIAAPYAIGGLGSALGIGAKAASTGAGAAGAGAATGLQGGAAALDALGSSLGSQSVLSGAGGMSSLARTGGGIPGFFGAHPALCRGLREMGKYGVEQGVSSVMQGLTRGPDEMMLQELWRKQQEAEQPPSASDVYQSALDRIVRSYWNTYGGG